jgi:REP element-mobilizing transposase RayT
VPFPLAYFLTWTVHSTWLHGDRRGWVDDRHNEADTPRIEPNKAWRASEREIANPAIPWLNSEARAAVRDTIVDHCRIRHWELHALEIRLQHVHVVVSCGEIAPEPVLAQFKGWATRRLIEGRCVQRGRKVWTYHGSTRYLWDRQSIENAVRYGAEMQGQPLP